MGSTLSPFCKWAGGKGQLLERIRARAPRRFGAYYEPFVGAGAVLFGLAPTHAHINDINAQLMNAYATIRDDCAGLMRRLDALDAAFGNEPKEHYYDARGRYSMPASAIL